MLFKPNKHYVAELEKKDYLGKAKVIIYQMTDLCIGHTRYSIIHYCDMYSSSNSVKYQSLSLILSFINYLLFQKMVKCEITL